MFKTLNPKSTKEVEIKGAKFKIGTVPYHKFLELQSQVQVGADKKDTKAVLALCKAHMGFVKWGLRGHSGIEFEEGETAPFETEEQEFDGKMYTVPTEDTLQLYVPGNLYLLIATEIIGYNMLVKDEEKN